MSRHPTDANRPTDRRTDTAPRRRRRRRDEVGMTTAEYAVGTVGACGFAGLLYQLLTSDFGRDLIQSLLSKVLDLLPF